MTFIDIFEHILDGFNFDNNKVDSLLVKTEDSIGKAIDKALDIIQ